MPLQLPLIKPPDPTAKLPCVPLSAHPNPAQSSLDNFGILKCSVKHDAHQLILVVLQFSTFVQAIISICGVASAFSGSRTDCTQYLGMMQLHFANWANFPCIAKQKANHKPGSDAVLLLLGQVNTTLEAHKSSDNIAMVPPSKLQKQQDTVDSTAQQQLLILDLTLQTYKLVSDHLNCLDKAVGSHNINKNSNLLN
ncbi:hypothetical protein C0989_007641 [Termitomyces sp. Mn162]|nr:hypothetical protein C0989_007641 [Termitomyces sp. Mn162]